MRKLIETKKIVETKCYTMCKSILSHYTCTLQAPVFNVKLRKTTLSVIKVYLPHTIININDTTLLLFQTSYHIETRLFTN